MNAFENTIPQKTEPIIEIKRLSELPKSQAVTWLIYGESGSGKTFVCGTAGSRAAIIDCGVSPLDTLQAKTFKDKYPDVDPIILKLRDRVEPSKEGGFETGEAFVELQKLTDFLLERDDVDFIIWDNATAIKKWAMVHGLGISKGMERSKTQDRYRKSGIVVPAVQDFGMEILLMEQLFREYTECCKSAGKHFVVTAHQRLTLVKPDSIGESPIVERIRPGFTGQTFPDDVPALFDEVYYMKKSGGGDNTIFQAQTAGDGQVTAKTTHGSGILRVFEVDPNLQKILERMRAGEAPPKPKYIK